MSHEENQSILESDPYLLLFQSMPDVVTVEQMCMMLGGISTKTGRKLLQSGRIAHFRIGRFYRIPKLSIINYLREIITPSNCFDALKH
ncbi:helix-turn-helix domain-containing protein [Cohnella sp. GCM10012308]|uniref:helix-turn-helix domain-containing protein n=1 Tax=Cohnella sp. GCM10012308 TaxID=3317329 RepID=UPI00361106F9